MKLKKELIGATIKVKDLPAVVIEDDPKKFSYYKNLGLDVFVKERKKKSDKANESNND